MSFVSCHPDSHFSIRNIPFGIFSSSKDESRPRPATIVGDTVVDIGVLARSGVLGDISGFDEGVYGSGTLNALASLPLETRRKVRTALQDALSTDSPLSSDNELQKRAFHPVDNVKLHLPVFVGDYTDFCASEQHTLNCGRLLKVPGPPLPSAWPHLPIGYHGRASSVVVSGTPIRRPNGIRPPAPNGDANPSFGPSRSLDVELEMAAVVADGNELGSSIDVNDAAKHIFGIVLMNDWSARDHQGFEMIPLGPFNGKNFGTTISPWIVTLDALEPFKTELPPRPLNTPLFPYLQEKDPKSTYDIHLEINMAAKSSRPRTIVKSNYKHLSYSFTQMLAHHTVGGCPMTPGDLLGSGTISGPTPDSVGSFLELSKRGAEPFELDGGEKRVFLEDGDEVELRGWADDGSGKGRVGFGSCRGSILPAHSAAS